MCCGVMVAHVVALTLCAAAVVRSAPLSPPPLRSTALAAPAASGAITSVYLPRWWTPRVACCAINPSLGVHLPRQWIRLL